MDAVGQLKALYTQMDLYVAKETKDGKSVEQALSNVFLRCTTNGDSHVFKLQKKTLWNKIVILFSSPATKAQYDIVNNISEISKLFGQVPDEKGAELKPLETRLNMLIDHVNKEAPKKSLTHLNFVDKCIAHISANKAVKEQEAQAQKLAQEQAQQVQKAAQEKAEQAQKAAKELQEQQQKIAKANAERKQVATDARNAEIKPFLRPSLVLLQEVLGINFTEIWTDGSKDAMSDVTGAINHKYDDLVGKLDALTSRPAKWIPIRKVSTPYGTEGTLQSALLQSMKTDLHRLKGALNTNLQEAAPWKKHSSGMVELFKKLEYLLIANGPENHPEYKTAKRVEAVLLTQQFVHEIDNLKARIILNDAKDILLWEDDINGMADISTLPDAADGAIQKLMGLIRHQARTAQSGYSEDSKFPEKKLIDAYMAFANSYLPT